MNASNQINNNKPLISKSCKLHFDNCVFCQNGTDCIRQLQLLAMMEIKFNEYCENNNIICDDWCDYVCEYEYIEDLLVLNINDETRAYLLLDPTD